MKTALFIIFVLLFSGCSTKIAPTYSKRIELQNRVEPSYKPKSKNWITTALFNEYKKWYQTPYEYGGTCLEGVDCSSLVQTIYKDAFNIDIPRTTKEQVKRGYKVSRNSTKEGDLVFFKTGYKTRHVGIIIEKGKFINTSTKHGVTISQLNNPYWKDKYWQSRRILP
jgi:lipoprotein Spr/probable lipoprotein NlpC